jgi:hypothetical protein
LPHAYFQPGNGTSIFSQNLCPLAAISGRFYKIHPACFPVVVYISPQPVQLAKHEMVPATQENVKRLQVAPELLRGHPDWATGDQYSFYPACHHFSF